MVASAPVSGLTLATWFWLLVPMLSCVVLSIVTCIGAAGRRRQGRSAPSA